MQPVRRDSPLIVGITSSGNRGAEKFAPDAHRIADGTFSYALVKNGSLVCAARSWRRPLSVDKCPSLMTQAAVPQMHRTRRQALRWSVGHDAPDPRYGKSRPAVDRVAPHCFVNINT